MSRKRVTTLVFAVCCVLVLTSLSASLNSTVSSTPDDVINLDYGSLPLTVQDAAELKETYETGQPDAKGDASGARQPETTSQNPSESQPVQSDQRATAIFQKLLEVSLKVLPVLVVLVTAVVVTQQRSRLLTWVEEHLTGNRAVGETPDTTPASGICQPTNQIEWAWLEMFSNSGVDVDPNATPRECTEELIHAGFDSDAAWELTTLFEEVRYGGTPVTSDNVHYALRCLHYSTHQEVAE